MFLCFMANLELLSHSFHDIIHGGIFGASDMAPQVVSTLESTNTQPLPSLDQHSFPHDQSSSIQWKQQQLQLHFAPTLTESFKTASISGV